MKRAELQDWVYAKVCDLLGQAAGFDRGVLDRPRIGWIVNARMGALQMTSEAAYAELLDNQADEVQQLIEHAIVPETRFFRDTAVFEHLRAWLQQLASASTDSIRVLSAPCSTGQEAYSLAALMLEAGIAPSRFTIDAVDISHAALAVAEAGVYPAGAFRHLSKELQRATGVLHGEHLRVHPTLRERICFAPRNLAQQDAIARDDEAQGKYQLILCRNLFIYLHRDARRTLAASLADALAPGGRLVLGSADRVAEVSERFDPVQPASSFAFRAKGSESRADQDASMRPSVHAHKRPEPARPFLIPDLPEKREAAPNTAEDLYLRAVLDHKAGDLRRAERRCRQALYLEPTMLPALELLESLWRHSPDSRLRRALGERIMRQRTRQQKESA